MCHHWASEAPPTLHHASSSDLLAPKFLWLWKSLGEDRGGSIGACLIMWTDTSTFSHWPHRENCWVGRRWRGRYRLWRTLQWRRLDTAHNCDHYIISTFVIVMSCKMRSLLVVAIYRNSSFFSDHAEMLLTSVAYYQLTFWWFIFGPLIHSTSRTDTIEEVTHERVC